MTAPRRQRPSAARRALLCLSAVFFVMSGACAVAQGQTVAEGGGFAQTHPALHEALSALGMYEVVTIMGTEGINGAAEVEAQAFPEGGNAAWQRQVTQMHRPERMRALFESHFPEEFLSPEDLEEIVAFATSDSGQRIVEGEVAARRIFLDRANVEIAVQGVMPALQDDPERLAALRRLNDANGLVERNVSGALNLRYAFFQGMIHGGAFEDDMPEALMVAEVYSVERQVRRQTLEWLYAFQLLAYLEVSNAELEAYVDYSQTEAGRALNTALFTAFDAMLMDQSYDLGTAAAAMIASQDT